MLGISGNFFWALGAYIQATDERHWIGFKLFLFLASNLLKSAPPRYSKQCEITDHMDRFPYGSNGMIAATPAYFCQHDSL